MFRTECKESEISVAIQQACPMPDDRRRISITQTDASRQNRLLAALSHVDFERLQPHLKRVSLSSGEVLHEPRRPLRYTYFPTTSIVSKSCGLSNGTSAEIAVVGNEGLVGVDVIMGVGSLLSRAVVHMSGFAYQLEAERLREEVARSGAMQQLLLRYTQTLITQMAQAAVCNRHHTVDQQLCRWLLLSLDRSSSTEIA
jgi:CRP-like cAMP-binding protein